MLEPDCSRGFSALKAILNRVVPPHTPAGNQSRSEPIGISALGYYLPRQERTIAELIESGQTNSSADKLVQLGFKVDPRSLR